MIARLWEAVTGTPWHTGQCMVDDFGPPPGVWLADEIAGLSNVEIVARRDELMARFRRERAGVAPVGGLV